MKYVTRKQYEKAFETLKAKVKALPGNEDRLIEICDIHANNNSESTPVTYYGFRCGNVPNEGRNEYNKAFGKALVKAATLCENFRYKGCFIEPTDKDSWSWKHWDEKRREEKIR